MRHAFFLLFCFFFVSSGFAQTTTPKMINLQAVLTDEGGNILYDKQESTMTFQIVDGAGQVLYEEEKYVVIHKGTMSVLVGSGNVPGTNEPTGGIPPEVLKPDGTRLLRYKLADQSIPQEDLVLVSVPYAMYAQDLATPLKSEQILDGTIRIEDLHEDLVAHIEGLTTTKTDSLMATHKSETSAHDASKISVNNRFNHLPGTTLQEVLQGLDYAIETRKQASLIVEGEVTTETGNRIDEVGRLDGRVNTEEAARIAADIAHVATDIDPAHPSGLLPTTRLSGTIGTSQIADNAVTSSKIEDLTIVNADLAEDTIETGRIKDGTIAALDIGTSAVTSDEILNETIDTLDLANKAVTSEKLSSAANTVQDANSTRAVGTDHIKDSSVTRAKIADGAVNGDKLDFSSGTNNLDERYVNVNGDTMTGSLSMGGVGGPYNISQVDTVTAANFSGGGGSITGINANNISSGELADAHIPSAIARDSELPSVITDHGGLGGLGDDDHTQYLELDGSDGMTGNLDMGSHNIVNIGSADHDLNVELDRLTTHLTSHPAPDATVSTGPQLAFAWASLRKIINLAGDPAVALDGSYNISSATLIPNAGYRINFTAPPPDTNYVVLVTPTSALSNSVNVDCYVLTKDNDNNAATNPPTSFQVQCINSLLDAQPDLDVLVFH